MASTRGERLRRFMKAIDLSAADLAIEVELTRQTITNYQKGDKALPEKAQAYLNKKHQLNREWYNTGEGSMQNYVAPKDAIIPGNEKLSGLLTEIYNILPPVSKYLIAEVKKEILINKSGTSQDEILKLLQEIKKDVNRPL